MNNPALWAFRWTCLLGQNGQAAPVGSFFPASLLPSGVTPGHTSEVVHLADNLAHCVDDDWDFNVSPTIY